MLNSTHSLILLFFPTSELNAASCGDFNMQTVESSVLLICYILDCSYVTASSIICHVLQFPSLVFGPLYVHHLPCLAVSIPGVWTLICPSFAMSCSFHPCCLSLICSSLAMSCSFHPWCLVPHMFHHRCAPV